MRGRGPVAGKAERNRKRFAILLLLLLVRCHVYEKSSSIAVYSAKKQILSNIFSRATLSV